MYRGHLPTGGLHKLFLAGVSAVQAIADPTRGDMVGAFAEVTGRVALDRMRCRILKSDDGRRLLAERPLVSKATGANADALLRDCAPGTFGNAYGTFMHAHGFDADDRAPVALVDDEELAYVLLRYRQCHDYWHVVCGLPPTLLGELALKWFELAHTGLPIAAFSGVFGPPALLTRDERRILATHYLPWALREGGRAVPLLQVRYDEHYHTPLADFRRAICLEAAPKVHEGP
ncbi:ubiquinone biosynthesis protein Coq4 [Pelagophyceae sp. CCMP2097]|nr:ubiquinone biosynthesis protein Coq4 [Pelagophyceae sp. CCMP2097]